MEESRSGTTTQASDLQGSQTTYRPSKDVKVLIKSLKTFSGVTGVKPSAKSWTAMLKATCQGCEDLEVLPFTSLFKGNALQWYELQVLKAEGQPWNSLNDFCSDLTAYFSWEEPLDETLDSWDNIIQETVLHYAQRIERLRLQLEL